MDPNLSGHQLVQQGVEQGVKHGVFFLGNAKLFVCRFENDADLILLRTGRLRDWQCLQLNFGEMCNC